MAKLAESGLSVGIFAPAWSFEHFPGHERDFERTVWEGTLLPEKVDCSCGDCASRHPANKELAVLRTAKERVAGSEHLFYTDFSRAFGTHGGDAKYLFDGYDVHAQLGQQSILPRPAILGIREGPVTLSHHIETESNGHVLVIDVTQNRLTDAESIEEWLPLYKLDMPADGSLHLSTVLSTTITPYTSPQTKDVLFSIYFKTTSAIHYIPLPLSRDPKKLVDQIAQSRIQELGIHIKGAWSSPLGESIRLMGIVEICITPRFSLQARHVFEITHVRLEKRGEGERRQTRLCWTYGGSTGSGWEDAGMPWSDVTGPFAHFEICSSGRLLFGRAYALEYILNDKFLDRWAGEKIEIEVVGIGFDGWELAKKKVELQL